MKPSEEDLRVARELAEGVLNNTPASYEVLAGALTITIATALTAARGAK